MTAETDTVEELAAEAAAHHEEAHADHPTPGQYWMIALILGVITAIEIAVPAIDTLDGTPSVLLLFLLGGLKFAMVVALFMHLKFDKPMYRNFFLIGLVGAVAMFVVVLLTFRAL